MDFNGFFKEDFAVFSIDGLPERMTAIKSNIQPKFQIIGKDLCETLTSETGNEMFLHIAKHARRTVNPPHDTWLAICDNNRGYKQHPHFQVGLFDDHLFIWLAYIYELPNKDSIANVFLDHLQQLADTIPDHYVISQNHLQKAATPVSEIDLQKVLTRFRDVKKAEFLVGKHIKITDPLLQDGEKLVIDIKETFKLLLPIYQLSKE